MHHRKPDPVVHHYPHAHHQPGTTATEKAAVIECCCSQRDSQPIDDDYELEMGIIGVPV